MTDRPAVSPTGRRDLSHESALRFIAGHTHDSPSVWQTIYRRAGGGYEGLQAVAAVALTSDRLLRTALAYLDEKLERKAAP